jgi:holliday junction DNA helicase RuvA
MYDFLRGEIANMRPTQLTIEVAGVGYLLTCSVNTTRRFRLGEKAKIWTHLVVREDLLALYGFHSELERESFNDLISVSGVGPKVAVALLSTLEAEDLPAVILQSELDVLTKTPGVGKKLAERLLLELKGRFEKRYPNMPARGETQAKAHLTPATRMTGPAAEACEALVALGYKPAAAEQEIAKHTDGTKEVSVEALVRLVLSGGR